MRVSLRTADQFAREVEWLESAVSIPARNQLRTGFERRGNADPLMWLGAVGRQYVTIVATDTLVAYALP